ncbi:hypothetical protein [Halostella sp. PRR32]|uniref:hypothetical protein n=1 Tax=Halostella sp. PRR32 TaxID=3098147 RepID=UPI002B1D647E|nr:hypothetical protein [Halostella sp. PRR32]
MVRGHGRRLGQDHDHSDSGRGGSVLNPDRIGNGLDASDPQTTFPHGLYSLLQQDRVVAIGPDGIENWDAGQDDVVQTALDWVNGEDSSSRPGTVWVPPGRDIDNPMTQMSPLNRRRMVDLVCPGGTAITGGVIEFTQSGSNTDHGMVGDLYGTHTDGITLKGPFTGTETTGVGWHDNTGSNYFTVGRLGIRDWGNKAVETDAWAFHTDMVIATNIDPEATTGQNNDAVVDFVGAGPGGTVGHLEIYPGLGTGSTTSTGNAQQAFRMQNADCEVSYVNIGGHARDISVQSGTVHMVNFEPSTDDTMAVQERVCFLANDGTLKWLHVNNAGGSINHDHAFRIGGVTSGSVEAVKGKSELNTTDVVTVTSAPNGPFVYDAGLNSNDVSNDTGSTLSEPNTVYDVARNALS